MKKYLVCVMALVVAVGVVYLTKVTAMSGSGSGPGPAAPAAAAPDFWADNSEAAVGGTEVLIAEETSKRSFAWNDFAGRGYIYYGTLDSVDITVSGTVSRAECQGAALVNGSYADYFRLYIKVPEGTACADRHGEARTVTFNDGAEVSEGADYFEDGYYVMNVRWLDGYASYGEDFYGSKVNCFYVAFFDDGDSRLRKYFVYVTYELEFTD